MPNLLLSPSQRRWRLACRRKLKARPQQRRNGKCLPTIHDRFRHQCRSRRMSWRTSCGASVPRLKNWQSNGLLLLARGPIIRPWRRQSQWLLLVEKNQNLHLPRMRPSRTISAICKLRPLPGHNRSLFRSHSFHRHVRHLAANEYLVPPNARLARRLWVTSRNSGRSLLKATAQ